MKLDLTKPTAIAKALKAQPIRKPIELTDNAIKGLSLRCRKMPDATIVGGFGVRIMTDGKSQRISLGDYASMNGTQARAAALAAREAAEQGQTIQSHKAAARQTRKAALVTGQAKAQAATSLHDFLFVDAPDRPSFERLHWMSLKSGAAAAQQVRNFMGDDIHLAAASLTQKDMERIFLRLSDKSPHSATRGVAYLRPALNHLAKRGRVPLGLLDLCEDHTVATVKRDRVLTKDEWVTIWEATTPPTPANNAIRTLMLTGARNREVAAMLPSELHLEKAEWHLPTDRSKNSDAHVFTLCPRAVDILRDQIAHSAELGYVNAPVFSNDGESAVWLGSKIKNAIDAKSGVTGWRVHDLRRSFATGLAESGVNAEIVDRMLNHRASSTMGGIAAIYNKSQRLTERHAAAEKWGQITDQWIDGTAAKVVNIG